MNSRHRKLIALTVVMLVTYLNALDNGFHFDDTHSIVENHHLRDLGNIPRFFVDSSTFSNEPAMAMYRPLLQTTYALNFALGGYQAAGYHVVNLVTHILCVWMVFAIVARLSASSSQALAAAILFGLHPLHSQVVNYISSRSESLAALGGLVAIYAMLVARTRLAAISYGVALMVKSTALLLLPLLLALKAVPQAALGTLSFRRFAPFVLISITYGVVISWDGFLPRSLAQEVRPLTTQWMTQLKATVYYLKLLVLPAGLSIEHAFQPACTVWNGTVVASALFVATLALGGWRLRRRLPLVATGLLWFFAALTLTFAFPLNVMVNEHRVYLASIGLAAAVASLWRWPSVSASSGVAIAGLMLALITGQRNAIWQDDLTLWSNAAARAPAMFRAQSNLGLALYEHRDFEPALAALSRSLELNPGHAKTWNNLGLVEEAIGNHGRAERAYRTALELRSDLSGTHGNLGRLHAAAGDHAAALSQLRKALAINSWNLEARVNLGRLYQQRDELQNAEAAYREALTLDPAYAPALNNLALLREQLGDVATAQELLAAAVRHDPQHSEARANLLLLQMERNGVPPREAYERVVAEVADRSPVWKALGDLRFRASDYDGAIAAYEKTLALDPGTRGVLKLLADAHRGAGRLHEAVALLQACIGQKTG